MSIRNKFLPIERAILLVVICCVGSYYFLGLKFRDPLVLYLQRIGSIFYMYAFMLIVVFFLTRVRDIESWRKCKQKISWSDTWVNFQNSFLNFNSIAIDIRTLNAAAILFVLIINLRHLVPYINQTVYDSFLVSFEESLFGGKILSLWVIDLFGLNSAILMSDVYELFYPYLSVIIFAFVLCRNRELSQQFFVSFVVIWMAGIVITCIWPTWGPCFYLPQAFAALPETSMTQMQKGLWEMKVYLEANPYSAKGAYLISAMPSLHVAVVALGGFYLWDISRFFSVISWFFVLLTVLATLYFGWHYLLDDLVAIFLAFQAFKLVPLFVSKSDSPAIPEGQRK